MSESAGPPADIRAGGTTGSGRRRCQCSRRRAHPPCIAAGSGARHEPPRREDGVSDARVDRSTVHRVERALSVAWWSLLLRDAQRGRQRGQACRVAPAVARTDARAQCARRQRLLGRARQLCAVDVRGTSTDAPSTRASCSRAPTAARSVVSTVYTSQRPTGCKRRRAPPCAGRAALRSAPSGSMRDSRYSVVVLGQLEPRVVRLADVLAVEQLRERVAFARTR